MRRIGDLLAELGFKKDSERSVQEAFVRHLVRHARSVSPLKSASISEQPPALPAAAPVASGDPQLSFDSAILGVQNAPQKKAGP